MLKKSPLFLISLAIGMLTYQAKAQIPENQFDFNICKVPYEHGVYDINKQLTTHQNLELVQKELKTANFKSKNDFDQWAKTKGSSGQFIKELATSTESGASLGYSGFSIGGNQARSSSESLNQQYQEMSDEAFLRKLDTLASANTNAVENAIRSNSYFSSTYSQNISALPHQTFQRCLELGVFQNLNKSGVFQYVIPNSDLSFTSVVSWFNQYGRTERTITGYAPTEHLSCSIIHNGKNVPLEQVFGQDLATSSVQIECKANDKVQDFVPVQINTNRGLTNVVRMPAKQSETAKLKREIQNFEQQLNNLRRSLTKEFTDQMKLMENKVVPVGLVAALAGNDIPPGWLELNGQEFLIKQYEDLYQFLRRETSWNLTASSPDRFRLPDLRGQFLRGLGGEDPERDRRVGSFQSDEIKKHDHGITDKTHDHDVQDPGHTHPYQDHGQGGYNTFDNGTGRGVNGDESRTTRPNSTNIKIVQAYTNITGTRESGGAESRPKNAAVRWLIKY